MRLDALEIAVFAQDPTEGCKRLVQGIGGNGTHGAPKNIGFDQAHGAQEI